MHFDEDAAADAAADGDADATSKQREERAPLPIASAVMASFGSFMAWLGLR